MHGRVWNVYELQHHVVCKLSVIKTRAWGFPSDCLLDLGGVTEIEMGVAGMTGDPLMNGTGIEGEIGIEIETVRGVEIDETVREARTDPPMMTG